MIARLALCLLLLSGCASPSHEYFGIPAQTVVAEGREFRVFLRRDGAQARAQVIRMGRASRRDHAALAAAMQVAAEQVSGCRAVPGSAQGDSGVLNLRLVCAD